MFRPVFTINPKITKDLMQIEVLKESIKNLPITPKVMKNLRDSARFQSVHYSTKIEGNQLTKKEVEQVLSDVKHFPGRTRDEWEIKGYYEALECIENNIRSTVTETLIKTIHALVEGKGRSKVKPTPYRDGQNVIRDSISGAIVYLPPESKDVSSLMKDLVAWLKDNRVELPVPILAAVAHYQFVTIHPYYDGNGRTARLLATLILYQGGYDLKGLYSLEEYYARDLKNYYDAIHCGDHHNYYFGRNEADITPWIEYFISGMLDAFRNVKNRAQEASRNGATDKSAILRILTPKQRKVLILFEDNEIITSKDIKKLFGFSIRAARFLLKNLVDSDFLEIVSKSDKTRSYKLAEKYESLVKNIQN